MSEIKQLEGREKVMMQREFDGVVGSGMPRYSKIEHGNCRAKREQITCLLQIDENSLVTLWIGDKNISAIGAEKELVNKTLKVMEQK